LKLKELAIRKAHEIYEQEYGQTSKKAFCGVLMDQLKLGNPFSEKATDGEMPGDKSMVIKFYEFYLNELKDSVK
jgi:hypothetical protein